MIDDIMRSLAITPAAEHVFGGPYVEVAVSIGIGQNLLLVTRGGLVLRSAAYGRSWLRQDWRWDRSHYPIRGLVMTADQVEAVMTAIEPAPALGEWLEP